MTFDQPEHRKQPLAPQPSKCCKVAAVVVFLALTLNASTAWAAAKIYELSPTTPDAVFSALAETAVVEGWSVDNIDRATGTMTIIAGAYNVSVLVRATSDTVVRVLISKKQVRIALRGVRGVEKKLSEGIKKLTNSSLKELKK